MHLTLAILLLHAMSMKMCEGSWNCEDGTLEPLCPAFAAAAADDETYDDKNETDDGGDVEE